MKLAWYATSLGCFSGKNKTFSKKPLGDILKSNNESSFKYETISKKF